MTKKEFEGSIFRKWTLKFAKNSLHQPEKKNRLLQFLNENLLWLTVIIISVICLARITIYLSVEWKLLMIFELPHVLLKIGFSVLFKMIFYLSIFW